jgi:ATP-grasp domain
LLLPRDVSAQSGCGAEDKQEQLEHALVRLQAVDGTLGSGLPSSEAGRTRALVVTCVHWPSTTRLCLALTKCGFDIASVAPPDHAMRRVRSVAVHYPCSRYADLTRPVADAIGDWQPDIVIPCDDPSLACLHELHGRAVKLGGGELEALAALIERSLGGAAGFSIARNKSEFVAFATALGVAVPETTVLRDRDDLRLRLSRGKFPCVLKVDGSWGGLGVRVLRSRRDSELAFAELVSLSSWHSMAKRMVKSLSFGPIRQWRSAGKPRITLQDHVEGRPANRAIVCWKGEVLAGLSVEALQTASETGPATVVRVIDHCGIAEVAARIAGRLGLSGFIGFDFILQDSGRAVLIEMNSRPTPICHLALSEATDLVGAFAAKVTGRPRRSLHETLAYEVIALFPQELWRDPDSSYLGASYHDVPWEEPEFVSAYVLPVPSDQAMWFSRLKRRFKFGGWRPGEVSKPGERPTAAVP